MPEQPHPSRKSERLRTLLQPATSIWVSSIVHFFRGFFSGLSEVVGSECGPWLPDSPLSGSPFAILRILPLFSEGSASSSSAASAECTPRPVSSRKFQAGKMRGEDGSASETRRCFPAADDGDGGNGAVNENVDVYGCDDVEGRFAGIGGDVAGGSIGSRLAE